MSNRSVDCNNRLSKSSWWGLRSEARLSYLAGRRSPLIIIVALNSRGPPSIQRIHQHRLSRCYRRCFNPFFRLPAGPPRTSQRSARAASITLAPPLRLSLLFSFIRGNSEIADRRSALTESIQSRVWFENFAVHRGSVAATGVPEPETGKVRQPGVRLRNQSVRIHSCTESAMRNSCAEASPRAKTREVERTVPESHGEAARWFFLISFTSFFSIFFYFVPALNMVKETRSEWTVDSWREYKEIACLFSFASSCSVRCAKDRQTVFTLLFFWSFTLFSYFLELSTHTHSVSTILSLA